LIDWEVEIKDDGEDNGQRESRTFTIHNFIILLYGSFLKI